MKSLNNWLIALDLTDIDDLLLGYANFLADGLKPDKITFLHIFESSSLSEEMRELFPNTDQKKDLHTLVQKELEEKINHLFTDDTSTELLLQEGNPTEQIITSIDELKPDLLLMGKKEKYKGEGILSKKIFRYVPCPVIFVPESVRYQLKQLLVPFNFNDHSAQAIKFGEYLADIFNANIQLQHIYQYPKQYFPYMPSENIEEKMQEQMAKKMSDFKEEYSIGKAEAILTLNKQEKLQDKIYNQIIKSHTDLIVVGSKSRNNIASFLKEDLSDRVIDYSFGIPVFIHKDKSQHKRLFESLLKD